MTVTVSSISPVPVAVAIAMFVSVGCQANMDGWEEDVGTLAQDLNVTQTVGVDRVLFAEVDTSHSYNLTTLAFSTVEGTKYRVSSKVLINSTEAKLSWHAQVECRKGTTLLDQRTDSLNMQQGQSATALYPRLLFTGPSGGGTVTCRLDLAVQTGSMPPNGTFVVDDTSYIHVKDVHDGSVEVPSAADVVLCLPGDSDCCTGCLVEDVDVAAVDPFLIPDVNKTVAVSGDVTLTACMSTVDGEVGCPDGVDDPPSPGDPSVNATVSVVFIQKRASGAICKTTTLQSGVEVLEANGGTTGTRSRHQTVYRGGLFTPLADPTCNRGRIKTYVKYNSAGVGSQKMAVHQNGGSTAVMPTP